MSILTGRCKHCGKTKEEHPKDGLFTDSGLAALDAHKEELYEQAKALSYAIQYGENGDVSVCKEKLDQILNQIEKEK